jgi:hypothetical protein
MGISNEHDVDIEEQVLKVEDTYGEEVAQKFSDLLDSNPKDAYIYLGKLFLGLIPFDEEDEDDYNYGEDDE